MKAIWALPLIVVLLPQREPVLQPKGVCSITEQSVVCWNPGGRIDRRLATEIERRLRKSNLEVRVLPRRKNRFVVVEPKPFLQVQNVDEQPLSFLPLHEADRPPLALVRIAVRSDARSGAVRVGVGVADSSVTTAAFRAGSRFRVSGTSFEMGPISIYDQIWGGYFPGQRSWRFSLSHDDGQNSEGLSLEAVGKGGQPILFVNADGRPFDSEKARTIFDRIAAGKWDWRSGPPEANVAQFHLLGRTIAGTTYATNIDPKFVDRLQIRPIVKSIETLGPYPLDPLSDP